MKSYLYSILILLSLTSCDVLKQKSSRDEDTTSKETVETTTFRKGDTVIYKVPVIRYKDTTIYTYNRQGTTLKTVYDSNGNVSEINCFTSAIEELKKENREFKQLLSEQQKDKKSEVSGTFMLYSMIGIVIVICVIAILAFIYLKSITPKIPLS